MRNYIDVAQDESGNALVGATCTVQQYPSGTAATIYSDNGLTPLGTNIVTTDVTGQFSFFAPDGDYILVLSVGGTPYKTQSPVTLFDGAAQLTFADTGSAANIYATSSSDQEKALRTGLRASFLAAHTNTGASTYSYNGLAAKPIIFPGGTGTIVAATIIAGGIYSVEYDGTSWQLRNGALVSPYYAQTTQESAAGITPSSYTYPYGDMRRYGVQVNGVDNTSIVQNVFNMFKTAGNGGTMTFQPGDYAFYLDISGGTNAAVFIQGNGCTFRPFLSNPAQSCVVFANNSGVAVVTAGTPNAPTNYNGTQVEFRNVNFVARLYGSSTAGDVNCAVAFYGANAKFWNCQFNYGKTQAFYGMYAQYTEFWSSQFNLANFGTTTAGCMLDSHTTSANSNEVLFDRCEFFVNSNGLWNKGAFKTRIRDCTFQGQVSGGEGAVVLDADGTSLSTTATLLDGNWFEANAVPHIYGPNSSSTAMIANIWLLSGGISQVTFSQCYDISLLANEAYGAVVLSITHPSGFTDTATLTMHGNGSGAGTPYVPTLSLNHSGFTNLDIHLSGQFTGTLTGMTTVVTGTFNYTIDGQQWSILCPGALTGTSNSTAFTVTGLPSILTPQTAGGYISVPTLEDNTTTAENVFASVSGTTLTFYKAGSPAGFTNAGSKGFLNPTIVQGNLF